MNVINQLIIEGTVAGVWDTVKSGTLETTICVTRTYKDSVGKEITEISHFPVVHYGDMADKMIRRLKIGRNIRVVGRLKEVSWTEYSENKKHSKTVIVAEHTEILGA